MIDWIEMTRLGANVSRWHIITTNGGETVGKHSFGVAMMCLALTGQKTSGELLKAALFHDLAEQATGDTPANCKWAHPELKSYLSGVEARFEKEYGLDIALSPQEKLILKWADMLDLLFFCLEQRNLGNRNMNLVFGRGVNYLAGLEQIDAGQEILQYLIESYSD